MADGLMLSVRVDADTAAELRGEAERAGVSVSVLLRRGIDAVLEPARAAWLDEHGSDPGLWEDIPAPEAGRPRMLDSRFGVRLNGEQLHVIGKAAEAFGMQTSAFMREAALILAAARAGGGTACCPHLSAGAVTFASCGVCGPIPVTYQVTAA